MTPLSTEHCEVVRVPAASFDTEARLSREAGIVDVAEAKGCDLLGSEKTWHSRQCVYLYAFIYTQKCSSARLATAADEFEESYTGLLTKASLWLVSRRPD